MKSPEQHANAKFWENANIKKNPKRALPAGSPRNSLGNNYLLKVNNRNRRTRCEICSK